MLGRIVTSCIVIAGLAAACSDPVHDGRLRSLGDERPDVPIGEYHRAGQACVLCHSADGPASNKPFSVAGTVFAQPASAVGVGGVTVAFTDAAGSQKTVVTNCVGNFFIRPTEWDPAFPILVRIYNGDRSKTMQGQIGRERSCAFCHNDPVEPPSQYKGTVIDPQFRAAGHIYLYSASDTAPPPDSTCPVNPNVTGGKF
jgi:hypothetical protein